MARAHGALRCIVPQRHDAPADPGRRAGRCEAQGRPGDGYRDARLPPLRDAWRTGLAALDAESRTRFGLPSLASASDSRRTIAIDAGGGIARRRLARNAVEALLHERVLHDICGAYYSHPHAWSEIGFGAPRIRAAMFGCISTGAIRGKPPKRARRRGKTRAENHHVDDAQHRPRGKDGRAPDVFRVGAWMPMREYPQDEAVDFAIIGTGAGGGTLACRLAEKGFKVVAFDAGAWWRPLEEFASDETHQHKLLLDRRAHLRRREPASTWQQQQRQGGGRKHVHFAMVSLRFRPEWFKSRSLLGYGTDWPLDWREMWRYYAQVEDALKISGPVNYPWGPKRPRYPYRPHELNAAALVLARGAEALGIPWSPDAARHLVRASGRGASMCLSGFLRRRDARPMRSRARSSHGYRAHSPPAPKSGISRWSAASRPTKRGRATGVEYFREGRWQFQRARNVVVAGYAIETPRLLLMSATGRFPEGLANSSGLVGKNLMAQSNQAIWGVMQEEIRWYKGPPSLASPSTGITTDKGKDFFGGYCYMSQGPLPSVGRDAKQARGLWGEALMREMQKYNHQAGLKIVGETLPQERNRVTLADEKDQYGLPVARVTYSFCDNDRRLIAHARISWDRHCRRPARARSGTKPMTPAT